MISRAKKTPFPVRLQMACESCEEYVRNPLKNRNVILDNISAGYYEGPNWSGRSRRPINMVGRYYNIMTPFLASNSPKSIVRCHNPALRGWANTTQLALNHLKKEIKYRRTLRQVIQNSLGFMGVSKVGEYPAKTITLGDETIEAGQPFFDSVDPADVIFDVGARRLQDAQFYGNTYRLPATYLKDSGLYKNYDKVKVASKLYDSDVDPEGVAKKDVEQAKFHELRDSVIVRDVYLPEEEVMVTIPLRGQGDRFLRQWDDFPEGGPYDFLQYHEFPGTVLGVPPAYAILDLDEQLNALARRMKRQNDREKTVMAYEGQAASDAERIIGSDDGEAVRVENIDRIKEVKFGGVQADSVQYADWLNYNVSEQGGNLNSLGGIRKEADTLGQEQLISAKSQGPVQDMLAEVEEFCSSVERKLAWHLIANPHIKIPLIKETPDGGQLETYYSEEAKEGDFIDYNFEIEPYSTQSESPEAAYVKFQQAVAQFVLPVVEIAAQQGQMLDAKRLLSAAAKFVDVPELEDLFQDGQPQPTNLGPYQPMQGQTKARSVQPDGRTSSGGANEQSNLNQQQRRTGGGYSAAV